MTIGYITDDLAFDNYLLDEYQKNNPWKKEKSWTSKMKLFCSAKENIKRMKSKSKRVRENICKTIS